MAGDNGDDVGEYASPACLMHEFKADYFGAPVVPKPAQPSQLGHTPRLLPHRALPPYAYLPGRSLPHPVRDPAGHSHGLDNSGPAGADAFAWGADLFNAGYYWEAHEAWELLWRAAGRGGARRAVLKGLILLAACGVKLREGKGAAAARHASRAADLFGCVRDEAPDRKLRIFAATLAEHAQALVRRPDAAHPDPDYPCVVFPFVLDMAGGL